MLLAKSGEPPCSLLKHTAEVEEALRAVREIWSSVPPILASAARFHDLGKAATGFQRMLETGEPWRFRHEVLSAAIFRDRHDTADPLVRRAYLALLTHHKNLGGAKVSDSFRECQSLTPYSQWFARWRELDVPRLREAFPDDLAGWQFDPMAPSPANAVGAYLGEAAPAFEDLEMTRMRGALVAADHLASSGLPPALKGHALTRDVLEQAVRRQLLERGEVWRSWSEVQLSCSAITGNAMLIAPTGTGKTEGALLWALSNRRGAERIFYVLPYQVSINAMAQRLCDIFRDEDGHSHLHNNQNVCLVHANLDLAYLQDALNDDLPRERAIAVALSNKNAARKIYAPLKVTTIYQLLNVFFGRKFFEVGLLEMSDSLVILDEIHAYDGHTFGLVLVMLEHLRKLGARVLIMTATLPVAMQQRLCSAAGINVRVTLGEDDALRGEVRRRISLLPTCIEDDATLEKVADAIAAGKKVAVVCNTVRKAMHMRSLLARFNPYLLHSRFTIGDRAIREAKDRITQEMNAGRVVISTQVIEVSLDVSFDVMFTELAPADSLLQRFGRVNRHGPAGVPAPVWVCCGADRGSALIYGEDLLSRTLSWLTANAAGALDFDASCLWIESVYPGGLSGDEFERMNLAQASFEGVVRELRPMVDPPASAPDLELNLFESIQVVPVSLKDQFTRFKDAGNHLEAKRLLVNVDLRAWRGAEHGAQRQGYELAQQLNLLDDKRDYIIANCDYTEDCGLDLLSINRTSDGQFF